MDVSEDNWPARGSVDGCENTNARAIWRTADPEFPHSAAIQQITAKIKPQSDCNAMVQTLD